MSGHTPGPWVIEGDVAALPDDIGVGIVNRKHDGDDWDVAMVHSSAANARLIAAAPDLLAALKLIVEADGEKSLAQIVAAMPDARAAIAKAEGK
jgi:hypothetical protein